MGWRRAGEGTNEWIVETNVLYSDVFSATGRGGFLFEGGRYSMGRGEGNWRSGGELERVVLF